MIVDYRADQYRCSYDHYGDRCLNRGVWKKSTNGSGEWVCTPHSECKTQMDGVRIIEESKRQNDQGKNQNQGGNL